jgi:ubiquinone/menaquinone biosynthesis C-methylase UbiE
VSAINEWINTEHAVQYLGRADRIRHRTEGESTLLELLPRNVRRVLDLGSGDGRLLAMVLEKFPQAEGVALDFSPAMLGRLRERFANRGGVTVVDHNLDRSLPPLGQFDAVVSSFAIHHCTHDRKRELYQEIFRLLVPGGVFCNLEHVASPNQKLHADFLGAIGYTVETEDPSNKLLDLEVQPGWLRSIGFEDVDCFWKWRELALMAGTKPA